MARNLRCGGGAATGSGTVEEFLELLLADGELLRAEFDAIIAAEWPGPPPSQPHRRVCGRPAHRPWRRHQLPPTRVPRPERGAHEGAARQRSPPAAEKTETNLKGR